MITAEYFTKNKSLHMLFTEKKSREIELLLKDAFFNINDDIPDEIVIWRIEGQNVGSLGNFSLLTGLPKAGKGKYICGITAAGLTRTEIFSMWVKLPPEKKAISYWDTEQSKHDHKGMLQTMLKLMETDKFPTHFHSYHCRKYDPQQIQPAIEYELHRNPGIGLLILDGLLDLIDSFNDEKQSKALVNFLKRITDVYNVHVLGVLHRSKSVDKSMGHLGSAADRAAQSVLKVEKDKERKIYVLSAEYLRNADDFNPVAIYYNKQLSLWEQCDYIRDDSQKPAKRPIETPRELDISVHTLNTIRIFNSQPVQSYQIFIKNISEVYGRGRNWSIECCKYLTQDTQFVFRTENGYTNVHQARLYIQK